ncbi:MAG: hypothetical protein A2339_07755 [Elusimicrobia bacterium RIFOXYB12_FULL_50_12]|nr:MAG: hypothetical protein A2278_02975 [Elusimicrobia bacterium RIFOXYA12_FULL_49_49]OGS10140.1 MAG: hypothetical protein A2386_02925 [Elusimicrobia bacterium RIFOXYB1_FULL_48_9]OGS16445.1 MAG: hypothetical protein A2251_06430 [Elusimicrobia bacterium RIFOXYA2_FULL_47_53]OGS27180.1 MAG: hypothetical protein A2339_07755 [Elusimicrobia bacterium RIFOXYB12_FULL_50_12]OGS30379.1 MAG: hypothetical protein A2323_02615 [Elusimicrobia bacterium RIFOXYB2_FULL_46_23]
MAKTLILGLGNSILRDDAAGIEAAKKIFELIDKTDVEFAQASYAGWRLVEMLSGFERVIIIDAMAGGGLKPGECARVERNNIETIHLRASHGMGLEEALALAVKNGQEMPKDISIFAVGVLNPFEFGEGMTEEVAKNIDKIASQIIKEEALHARMAPGS